MSSTLRPSRRVALAGSGGKSSSSWIVELVEDTESQAASWVCMLYSAIIHEGIAARQELWLAYSDYMYLSKCWSQPTYGDGMQGGGLDLYNSTINVVHFKCYSTLSWTRQGTPVSAD